MLRYRYMLQLSARTVPDNGPIAVIIARGDATLAEIQSSLQESNTVGPKDLTQMLTQDQKWASYGTTLMQMRPSGNGTEAFIDSGWRNFGGKGIPALEDTGFQVVAWNSGSAALTTGSSIDGSVWVEGVWLND